MGSAVFFLGAVFFFWDVSARWFRAKKTAHELGLRMVRDEHKVSDMEQRKAPKFIKIGELERRLMRAKQEAQEKMAAKQASHLKSKKRGRRSERVSRDLARRGCNGDQLSPSIRRGLANAPSPSPSPEGVWTKHTFGILFPERLPFQAKRFFQSNSESH